jgi:hypothetical protein
MNSVGITKYAFSVVNTRNTHSCNWSSKQQP